jgi:hypothetical protein
VAPWARVWHTTACDVRPRARWLTTLRL